MERKSENVCERERERQAYEYSACNPRSDPESWENAQHTQHYNTPGSNAKVNSEKMHPTGITNPISSEA